MSSSGTVPENVNPAPPVTDEQLMDWAAGQLPSPQREQVETALAGSPALRRRADAVRRTLAVLDQWEADEPADDLAEQVGEFVASASRPRRVARPSIFSLAEITTVAAALLLLALVFVPPVRKARFMQEVRNCEANMRLVGLAMEHYANDNANMLPYLKLDKGDNWLNREAGRKPTGTAPLFLLVRAGRIQSPTNLICPAAGDDAAFAADPAGLVDFPDPRQCSFSFQNLFGASKPIMRDEGRAVPVLADRNPLFRDGRPCTDDCSDGNSFNHEGRGQNVLWSDGRVTWERTPRVGPNSDNIWQAGAIRSYQGTETSQGPDDWFFAP